jgi:RecA-family ATPase
MELPDLLAFARRGWKVFPLSAGSKKPLPGSNGLDDATSDEETLERWHTPELNWGLNCGASGIVVLDVDTKKGHRGHESLAALRGSDLSPTYTVVTPSGGLHLYYQGEGKSTAGKLGDGLDTRGAGGYVVLPGSQLDGVPYRVEHDSPVALLPDWISQPLGRPDPIEERDHTPVCELDQPSQVSAAIAYLLGAPVAVEGQGGDTLTYHTACAVKDRGISEDTCVALLAVHWNERCSPPWDAEELARKVHNAYAYAQEAPGSKCPEAAFQPVPVEAPAVPRTLAVLSSDTVYEKLPKRQWVLGRRLIRGFVSLLIAPGGASKSTLSMLDLLAVATGQPLTGEEVYESGAVWVWNTEDPDDELARRIHASAQHHKVGRPALERFHVSSGLTRQLTMAASERGVVAVNEALVSAIIAYIRDQGIVVWCVDPLAEAHQLEENDNQQMVALMRVFRRVAQESGCCVLLVHHTRKPGNTGGGEGDMNTARGASSVVGAARIVHTLYSMSAKEADVYGISEDARRWYVRLDDAKGNLSPPADGVRWFRRVDHVLPNGDHVGTLETVKLEKVEKEDLGPVRDGVFRMMAKGMYVGYKSTLDEVAADLKTKDDEQEFQGTRRNTLVRQVREAFQGVRLYYKGRRVHCEESNGTWYLWTETAVSMLGDEDEEEARPSWLE